MTDSVTRRGLLGGAAGAAAAASLPGRADAAKRKPARRRTRRTDVIVVGAGLAGLAAAEAVAAAGKSVVVLEARDRVGGRILNRDIGGGEVVEIGGQWIGPTQDVIAAWAKELGVATFKTYNEGDYIYVRDGRRTPYRADTPVLGAIPPDPGAAEAGAALAQINAMAAEVPLEAPWTAKRAPEWDSQTCRTWIEQNTVSEGGRFLTDLGVGLVYAAEARDVSLLQLLFNVRAAGNETTPGTFERLINTAGGAQETRFAGGSQRIAIEAARRLGGRVVLRAPVRRIVQSATRVRAETDRLTVSGRRCIVTGPPSVTDRIAYHPILPALRAQLTQRMPQGSAIKCHAIYPTPFWRADGLAGQAVGDRGPCRVTFDNSPPDGSPGVLLGFVEGSFARAFSRMGAEERRAAVLGNFAEFFGEQARRPTAYFETNWAEEEWTRGCFAGFCPPGVLSDYGPELRAPFGRVHWAGADVATVWNAYMDGAVRSGRRAAAEALADL